ncbi:MAG: response regulator transcription factor [Chitinophagales bacterium]
MKFLISDDHPVVRKGLTFLLLETFPGAEITEVVNNREVLEKLTDNPHNLILMDISVSGFNGLDTLRKIRTKGITTPILVMGIQPEDEHTIRVINAGASGYINKICTTPELINAIRTLLNGRTYISSEVAEQIAVNACNKKNSYTMNKLSSREMQVLQMIASGKMISEIASMIYLRVNTVSTYRSRILEKLHLHNNAELTRYAMDHRIA